MERNPGLDERQYTLQELVDSAGVSIRTIRYYIGEGLLPGPEGAGPQSHYTESHAQRLRAISLLKDRYLPLKEIRRQLTGLDDAAIQRLITDLSGPEEIDSTEDQASPAAAPMTVMNEFRYLGVAEPQALYDTALDYIDSTLSRTPAARRAVRESGPRERKRPESDAQSWRKIEVADGVELLVREDIYRRRRDRIDWLIDWARKVVD